MATYHNKAKQVKSDPATIVFLIGILIVTLATIMFTVFIAAKPFKVTKVSNIKEVTIENYKTLKPKEYYVYVFNESSVKDAWLSQIIIEYANYARTHPSTKPIYILDFEDERNEGITGSSHLNISDSSIEKSIPTVVLIKDGSISKKYDTYSKIGNALYEEMSK